MLVPAPHFTTHSQTLEVKKSKFIAFVLALPSDATRADVFIDQLRQTHPKSSHVVYAMRLMDPQNQARFVGSSDDDGEPKHSAGKPLLHLLETKAVVDVALIVVRYFGGIKLGFGGLVRAYGGAGQQVLHECLDLGHLVPYVPTTLKAFCIAVRHYSAIKYWLDTQNLSHEADFKGAIVALNVQVPLEQCHLVEVFFETYHIKEFR